MENKKLEEIEAVRRNLKGSRLKDILLDEIREKLWKEAFWSQSYCLLTTGGATIDVIRKYIETQGEEDGRRKETRSEKYRKKVQALPK